VSPTNKKKKKKKKRTALAEFIEMQEMARLLKAQAKGQWGNE